MRFYPPQRGAASTPAIATPGDMIAILVESAPTRNTPYEVQLNAKIEQLTEIVGILADALPASKQVALAEALGWKAQ